MSGINAVSSVRVFIYQIQQLELDIYVADTLCVFVVL